MKIEARDVSAGYGAGIVISGFNLSVPAGQIVTLIGANGSGKSTILKTLGRILRPVSGAVFLDGKDIRSMHTKSLARRLSILPQINHAPEDITVEDLAGYGRFPHMRAFQGMTARDKDVVGRVLAMTRLEDLRERPVASLSGGERQRAWIAMTLAQEPEVMLLDEPTTYLDVRCQFEVVDLVSRMNRELGLTIVMVLHDLNLAARCSHRLVAVKDKRIFRDGEPPEIITRDVLREVFGVEAKIMPGDDGVPYFIPTGSVSAPAASVN